jgi:hypothetical protein
METFMTELTAQTLREAEERIDHLVRKIGELEDAKRWFDAARTREMLAVITDTRDALRLRLRVAQAVVATQARRVS